MTPEINNAKATLAALHDRRRLAAVKLDELQRDRKRIAFDAHGAGNAHAQKRLAELNSEIITTQEELRSLDDAIDEAGRRVKVAEANLANAAERKKAQGVLSDAAVAEKCARQADAAGQAFRIALLELDRAVQQLSKSGYPGVATGRAGQLAISRSVHGLLVGLRSLGVEVPVVPPAQRRTLVASVEVSIKSARDAAQQILGRGCETDAAA